MTKLGEPVSGEILTIRDSLRKVLEKYQIEDIDAESVVTGKDFLMKIWNLIVAVPLGIAIIDNNMPPLTLSNIFYEIGLMQAYGKETLVIKTKEAKVPSDFVRTEYIEYGQKFEDKMDKFFNTFFELPKYYDSMANELEKNPLLAIDYLRRAYLIAGDSSYRDKAEEIFNESIEGRAKNSVEALLAKF
ncbi:hypothetical protein RE474_09950 [Methanolobus sediminis]|uniref:Uncharacterized protein n=1 Tax=Methanolobus sediminis TaxID=3072978 RepID=A0AA51ULB0_9EURY|nr:hypothetical protein [Methanolobus sediminis]WMW24406.1 hypothetical protein RE474_09950 [Methanolobus sediminis]